MKFNAKKYNLAPILFYAQRAFGSGKSKKIKPIKWEVDAEQLHEFLTVALEENGFINKRKHKKADIDDD